MRQSVRDRLVSFQREHEAEVPWMHLDQLSYVSVGIGFLIDSKDPKVNGADLAVKLGGFVRKSDGSPATEKEIRDEWRMVKDSGTAGKWKQLENITNLRLPTERIRQITVDKANAIVNFLKSQGYPWDSYPADGQLGLLSIGWIGIGKYPTCLKYIKQGNWFYAAGEATFPTQKKRQDNQQRLMRNAARVISRGLDPDVLWFDEKTDGRAFFFKGNRYLSYDIRGDFIEPGRPALIDSSSDPANDWPGFAKYGFGSDIDAALNLGKGKVYFFKDNVYLTYDIKTNQISRPPVPIDSGNNPADDWPGFSLAGFGSDIDAAINWGDGRAFFFKGGLYLTYDIANNKIFPPLPIDVGGSPVSDWKGMKTAGFDSDINAAVNWGDGRVFFFKGNRYLRYDIHPGQVASGFPLSYPLSINDQYWPGFANKGFSSQINAAVDWG